MKKDTELQWNKEQIADEAAAWILDMQEENASDSQLKAWEQWVQQSPLHAETYEKMTTLFCLSGEVSCEDLFEQELVGKCGTNEGKASSTDNRENSSLDATESKKSTVAGKLGRQLIDFTHRLSKSLTPRQAWLAAPATIALAAIIILVNGLSTTESVRYKTGVGEHLNISLSDGSALNLSAKTHLEVLYSAQERRVKLLKGEALFEVTNDPSRPFVVETGHVLTKVVGTIFDVHRYADEISVAVVEGIVQVDRKSKNDMSDLNEELHREGSDDSYRLTVGEKVRVPKIGEVIHTQNLKTELIAPWMNGQLVFRNEPLYNVISDINRYSEQPIILASSVNAEKLDYTGTIYVHNLAEWLEALPLLYDVNVTRNANNVLIQRKRQ